MRNKHPTRHNIGVPILHEDGSYRCRRCDKRVVWHKQPSLVKGGRWRHEWPREAYERTTGKKHPVVRQEQC